MKNPELERLRSNLLDLENQFDDLDINEFEERLLNLQDELIAFKAISLKEEVNDFIKLKKKINNIKKKHNFHQEQSEKDRMFPNIELTNNLDSVFDDDLEDDF